MTAPSATPRTDAALQAAHDSQNNVILAEVNNATQIARTLERELAEANRRLSVILDLVDGKVDVEDGEDRPRPNIFMQIETAAEGRDQP